MVVEEKQIQGPTGREEKVLVSVRLRPLNEKELAKNDVLDWECINGTSVIYRSHLSISERSMYPTAYTFDKVFGADCSTRQVYEEGAKEVAFSVVSGVNASVFAYGQTSSGKTYTMKGITNYTMTDIYEYIEKHKEREFHLKFSAMEIYNESVRDLLSADSTPLRLLDDPEKGTVVEKLTEETLRDWNHFKELLSVCEAQRQIGETALNEVSSRSHQILKLTIESTAREFFVKDKMSALTATVNFIDLAGSERASQSLSAGTRLKEGCHINRSLLTLGTVIRKLSKGKNGHIPFRDSKLTRILQSSLGGNARTAIICTMSPAKIHVEQSRNTLLFASCAKDVTTNAQVNVVMSDKALVKHLQNELARMESQLRTPARAVVSSDTDMLQRKKDIEIEKLKKEVLELTEQLRLARSEIEDLRRMAREEKVSTEMEKPSGEEKRPKVVDLVVALENRYPKLRVKNSWEFSDPTPESPMSAQSSYKDEVVESSHISPRSTQHRHVGSDESLAQLKDLEASFLNTRCSIQPSVGVPDEEIEEETYAHVEEIEEQPLPHEEQSDVMRHVPVETKGQSDENSKDHCREVRCIEMESSSMNRREDSDISECSSSRHKVSEIPECSTNQYEVSETMLPCAEPKLGTEAGNRDNRVNEVSGTSVTPKEESEPSRTPPHRGIFTSGKNSPQLPVKDITTNRSNIVHPNFVSPSPEKPSPWLLGKETPRFRGLMLIKSRSCKGFMSNSSLSWFEQDENITSMMPNWFEKQAIDLPTSIQSTPSASQYNVNNETSSPNYSSRSQPTNQSEKDGARRSDSVQTKSTVLPYGFESKRLSSSESQDHNYEHKTKSVEDSNSEIAKHFARMNESNESTSTHDKQIIHHPDEEMEMNSTLSTKSLRNVALAWPLQFNRLQREIIELWHACNVSLGHRTYFFLLFRGDQEDCVYLEVEHRRLSFIKESFSRGSRAVEEGRTLSPSSSMRALNRERYKLSQQMQKKLTQEERENLFLRWGISLNTKHRRLQLAHRLWSDPRDMEHIQESASVVGKLLGFVDMNLASREMFGLNFSLRPRTKKPSRWKRSVLALSIL